MAGYRSLSLNKSLRSLRTEAEEKPEMFGVIGTQKSGSRRKGGGTHQTLLEGHIK
jgi:hypothetical protein